VSFAADMVTDALSMCNPDEHGELLDYTPAGGAEKSIRALVNRSPVGPDFQLFDVGIKRYSVIVPRDATLGLTSVNAAGNDTVKIKEYKGTGSAEVHRVERIVRQNPGIFELSVVR